MKIGKRIGYLAALTVFLILTMGPFLWTFVLSVTPEYAMMEKSTNLLPKVTTFDNYRELLTEGTQKGSVLMMGIKNALKAVGATLLLGIPISMMSAYALSRMEFRGRRLIKNLLLITMVIPVMATIIPLFRLFVARHWLDNVFWLSMVYVSSYLPLVTWLMSNYFATIPKELEEAALIDGCGRIASFLRIIVPTSYPIILSAALIMFLNTWSQFQIPLILASSLETKPVAIVVSEFMTKDSVQYGLTAAAGMIAVIPPAVTALVFRRFLISGMMGGAVKG
ncbi:carbohydrate ABC transporter permease [Sporofaciens musculi]|jgi:multiple sugar transport system permease protein|uniref:carbohydrate ABC transporter permease n=1 Tax=Sporofaciens musculi TaxID=2681861 RepID=UPI0025712A83|nr:carbohydrate ABC transporter permease [Sporofaciens musculi]